MDEEIVGRNLRILVVDDNRAIHEDFRKILGSMDRGEDALAAISADIFGTASSAGAPVLPAPRFEMDSTYQGEEGLAAVVRARAEGRPYAMAFVDMRMPPGWDGLETVTKLWEAQSDLQVVICTAFSDYSWHEIFKKLAYSDRLLILRKPFDAIEVQQLAAALTEKWRLTQQFRLMIGGLETKVQDRTAQLEATLEQLVQAQKMEAIGRLAGGVAHDFNNLLTVIQGHCGLLLASASAADAELTESVKEIQAASIRAANLTRQLLTFSRRHAMQTKKLDLDDVVLGVGHMLQRLIGEDIVLHIRLLAGGAWIDGDSGMIEQVVINLAVNARDAMSGGGELWIELDEVTFDETAAHRHPGCRPGSFIRLSVRDTGSGIAEDHLPHIFEPFFTTKEVGKGTGLGLATVHGIVEQHHGWIEVQSHPGAGTTFWVHLPSLHEIAALPDGPCDTSRVRGGVGLILVVEDEPAVRTLATRILETEGYRVQAASSGAEALELWRQQAGAFDVLLTDLVMPGGISGGQLAERLRTDKPGLRVIYMSGYPGDTASRGLALHEGVNFLQKPFDPTHLTRAVRSCFDSG
jgi:signal transduction histidine kinase